MPPKGGEKMFGDGYVIIYVPTESVEAYKAADYWSDYAYAIVSNDYSEKGITVWRSCYIYSQYKQNAKYDTSCIYMKSAKGTIMVLYVRNSDNPVEKGIAADTYPVDTWQTRMGVLNDSKVNGVNIASGEMIVETVDEVYKISFQFVDANGTEYEGYYEGSLPYTNYTHL